jgi:hypothetical protein
MSGDQQGADQQGAGTGSSGGRIRRWVHGRRTWTTRERSRVEDALVSRRDHSTLIGAGFDIAELDVHVGGGILAGAVAFRLFLFLVPFVYVLFTAVGLASKAANQDPRRWPGPWASRVSWRVRSSAARTSVCCHSSSWSLERR